MAERKHEEVCEFCAHRLLYGGVHHRQPRDGWPAADVRVATCPGCGIEHEIWIVLPVDRDRFLEREVRYRREQAAQRKLRVVGSDVVVP